MSHHRIKPSRWTHTLAAGLLLCLTAWSFPYFPGLGSPNELSRLYLTRAMVDDGSFSIDGPVKRYGPITDMSRFQGKLYTDKAPGTSMAGIPVYFMLKLFHAWRAQDVDNALLLRWLRVMTSGIATSLTLIVLLGLFREMGLGVNARLLLGWAWAAGTIAFPYSSLLYGHGLCALWLVLSLLGLVKIANGSTSKWVPLVTGASLGAALLTEYTSVLLVGPLGIAAVWISIRRPRTLLLGALGASIPLALLAIYHQACFGAPWATGYAHLANRHYAHVHEQGFMGLVAPSAHRLWLIIFSSTRGLLFYSPWLVLAPLGMYQALRSEDAFHAQLRPIWTAIVAATFLYLLFAMSLKIDAWGWSLGPRHLTPLLPFLALATAMIFSKGKRTVWTWMFFGAAVPYSIVATVTPFVVFGGFPPDFTNPLADFIAPLATAGCFGPNLASEVGLPAWVGAVLFFMGMAALIVWIYRVLPLRGWYKYAAALAALLVIVCAFGIRGDNPAKEDRAYNWVYKDIIRCSND